MNRLELRPDLAPKTVANFLSKFNSGYCNNLTWHRVERLSRVVILWVMELVEIVICLQKLRMNLVVGSVGVARKEFPKEFSNDSQFFITKKDSQFLNNEYTYFGKVTSGMNVVNSLSIGDKFIETVTLTK